MANYTSKTLRALARRDDACGDHATPEELEAHADAMEKLEQAAKAALQMMMAWQIDWYESANNPTYKPAFDAETLALKAALAAQEDTDE